MFHKRINDSKRFKVAVITHITELPDPSSAGHFFHDKVINIQSTTKRRREISLSKVDTKAWWLLPSQGQHRDTQTRPYTKFRLAN